MSPTRVNSWIMLGMACCLTASLSSLVCGQTGTRPASSSLTQGKKSYDPSDIFLEIYQLSTAAEKLDKSGDSEAAYKALMKAEGYLNALSQDHPDWQPNVVRYRRNTNAKAIEKLKGKLKDKPIVDPSKVKKPSDFLDNAVIIPNKNGSGDSATPSSSGTSSGKIIMPKSAYEIKLENQIQEIMAELNETRSRAERAENQLNQEKENQQDTDKKIAALQAELESLRNAPVTPPSAREQEIQQELEKLAQSNDPDKEKKQEELKNELAKLRANASESKSTREESLERQITALRSALHTKTNRELDLERQVKDLRSQITSARSEREKILEQKLQETINQLAEANERARYAEDALRRKGKLDSTGTLGTYDALNQELLKTQAELAAVTRALRTTRTQLEDALERAAKAEAGESAYKGQLDKTRSQLETDQKSGNKLVQTLTKQLSDLEKKLQESAKEKEQASSEISQLKLTLKETEDQLTDVTNQRDTLKTERDQLADIIKLNNPSNVKEVLEQNVNLAKQLKDAQNRVKLLENSVVSQAVEIESAKSELAFVKKRMIELRDENTEYRKRVSQLNEKLRQADTELEKMSSQPDADPELVNENKLLRDAISKQLRVLASRVKSRELLEAAYKRLNLNDPQMADAIKALSEEENLALSNEELALIEKNPDPSQLNPDAVFVAPGYPSPSEQAKAYANLQVEVEALGKGASNAYEKGRYAAAEQLYQTLLDKHPGHYPAHVNLGVIYLKEKKVALARDILQSAVDLNPDHPVGQFLLGIAHYRLGEDAAAQMSLSAASQLDPANARIFFYLGNISSSAGKYEQAVKQYQRALELDSTLVDVYYNLASTYLKAGKLKEARRHYDLSIRAGALPDPDMEQRLKNITPTPTDTTTPGSPATPASPEKVNDSSDQASDTPSDTASSPSSETIEANGDKNTEEEIPVEQIDSTDSTENNG